MKILDQFSFNDFVSQDTAVVEFYAEWCQPCKTMNRILKVIETDYDTQVAKVDIDLHPNIASAFEVASIPTTVFFKNGREVNRVIGAKPVSTLVKVFGLSMKTVGE